MPKRIDALTDEQKSHFDEWVEKWKAVGLSCEPANYEVATDAVNKCYKKIERPEPISLRLRSPFAGVYGGLFGSAIVATHKVKHPKRRTRKRHDTDPRQRDPANFPNEDQIRQSTEEEVIAQLSSLNFKIDDELLADAKVAMRKSLSDWTHYRGGNLWASWYAYISFFRDICDWENEGLEAFGYDEQYALNAGWCWYGEDVVGIADRPEELHFDGEQLHRDGGPAVMWRDGWAIWSLNGVRVPRWLAETPGGQLDVKRVTTIDNAEVRREFVRKVGVERICHKLSKGPIDKDGDYELHQFDVGTGRLWTYLKMQNPSVPEVWHLEGVPADITTVDAALCWRNGFTEDMIDDENGADWYQQGDVTLKPRGAKKFKRKPIIQT